MNRNRLQPVARFILLTCIGGALVWLCPTHSGASAPATSGPGDAGNNQAKAVDPKTATSVSGTPTLTEAQKKELRAFLEAVRRDPKLEWRFPINFWGKVVDENDHSIAGATVHFTWNDLSAKGTSEKTVASDGNGLFSLTGQRGKGLSVIVSKSGYYQVPGQFFKSVEYAIPTERFHADPNKPEIFRLHRMGEFVEIHSRVAHLKIPNNGPELIFDWLKDRLSTNGQLQVQIEVDAEDPVSRRFGWRFLMRIPEGGFIPIRGGTMPLLAPESGYEQSVEISRHGFPDPWPNQYFIAFGNPRRYGRIKLELSPFRKEVYRSSGLFLWYWINASGSRSLEGDPKKGIPSLSFEMIGGREPSVFVDAPQRGVSEPKSDKR